MAMQSVRTAVNRIFRRSYCTQSPITPLTQYDKSLRWMHWIMGGLLLTSIGTVKSAQWTEDKEKKAQYMHIHKSVALILLAMLPLRLGMRLTSRIPPHLPGSSIEKIGASLSHFGLYAAITILPISGVTMGYFGGKGLPFFNYHIKAASETKPEVAKKAFKIHKLTGQVFTYLVPLHIAGAGYHFVRGQAIFHRMNPFT